jgi:hypothetical protein
MSAAFEFPSYEQPETMPQKPHLLAVVNPGSSNYQAANEQAHNFAGDDFLDYKNDVMETDINPKLTEEKLHDKLSSGRRTYDGIVALTGDGGANVIARYLLLGNHPSYISDMPVYLGGFGNANDGHSTVVGKKERGTVANQPVVPIFPLEATITPTYGDQEKQIGLFYQGLGFTALASEGLNSDTHRQSRLHNYGKLGKLAREALTVGGALFDTEPFGIKDHRTDKELEMQEYVFSHGPRMAKMGLFPGDPTSQEFKAMQLRDRKEIFLAAMGLLLHVSRWQTLDWASFRVHTSHPGVTVPFQFDGETIRLRDKTDVHIRTSQKPLRLVAPRLLNNES